MEKMLVNIIIINYHHVMTPPPTIPFPIHCTYYYDIYLIIVTVCYKNMYAIIAIVCGYIMTEILLKTLNLTL